METNVLRGVLCLAFVFLGAGEHLAGGKVEVWTETAETGWRRETRLENAGAAFPFHGSSLLSSFPGLHKPVILDIRLYKLPQDSNVF